MSKYFNLYTIYMSYSNEKRIELVDEYINKTIILFKSFIDKCHEVLNSKNSFLLTYDQMYKILSDRHKYKILITRLEKLLLKDKYTKLYIYNRLQEKKDIFIDYKELDEILESNHKCYMIFEDIKENIFIIICGYMLLCLIYKLFFVLELY